MNPPNPSREKMGIEPSNTDAVTRTNINRVYPAAPITTHLKTLSPLLLPRRRKEERNIFRSLRDPSKILNPPNHFRAGKRGILLLSLMKI
jgi:hypothetical protein